MLSQDDSPALLRAGWQPAIFAERPRRSVLLGLKPAWPCRRFALQVVRNRPFELVESALAPFLAFADLAADVSSSDYDDSLARASIGQADVALLWLDYGRYREQSHPEALVDWLGERLRAMRATGDAPILVCNWDGADDVARAFNAALESRAAALPGVRVGDVAGIARRLGGAYVDDRLAELGGSRMSDAACLALARALGSSWLPALLAGQLKAVVVDLDDTLYDGVLGEDGAAGLALTPGHAAFQERLATLAAEGMLLAVASRNSAADVDRLFAERPDFPLRREAFSAIRASWGPKAAAIREIAARLRIGTESILFCDDNAGELAAVGAALPEVRTLHVPAGAAGAARALEWYPGLFRWAGPGPEDFLRARDLGAGAARTALREAAADRDTYLRSLGVRLEFARDPSDQIGRLFELSQKTNQFNLALGRLAEAEVARRVADPGSAVVAVRLADRLADAGVVGALFARQSGDRLVIDELCVSCRALGRDLEDVLVAGAIQAMGPGREIAFRYATGPRNWAARAWLARFAGTQLGEAGEIVLDWGADAWSARLSSLPVTIRWLSATRA